MEKLENILINADPEDFPGNRQEDYMRYYENAKKFLRPIQESAGAGAMAAEIKAKIEAGVPVKAEEILHLNNHGPEHIRCVIERCSRLVAVTGCNISGYEAYILLVAINLHDAGNIEGRMDHEKKVFKYIAEMGEQIGSDSAEKRLIGRIAAVHGGRMDGSKDTIRTLQEGQHILGKPLDCRFLAALVRFADELADDSTRASKYMLKNELLSALSEIFHQYSLSLTSVQINNTEINLSYHVDHEVAIRTFSKDGENVYLIDEIYSRMLKMHQERIYCSRHLRHRLEIGPIRFRIEVSHPHDPLSTFESVTGTLQEIGFPDAPTRGIFEICPELDNFDGLTICNKIEKTR
jgi:hypothetical protein